MNEERFAELERRHYQLVGEVGVIKAELVPLKEGVQNFRAFQQRGMSFFDRHDALLDAKERRRKRHVVIAGIVAPFLLAIGSFFGYQFWSLSTDVIQIVHEWRELHQESLHPRKSFFSVPQFFAEKSAQQDSSSQVPVTEEVHHDAR